jgi:hypothetical protein
MSLRESLAGRVAESERASRLQAREAVAAAIAILEWRLECDPPPWRVERLARLLIEYERTRAAPRPQLELFR